MNNELVQTGFFDLEPEIHQKTWHIGLEDRLQDTLRQRAAKIKAVVAQANFIIGEELATAQKELTYKNGGFIKWVEEEIGIEKERAYEFIRIWEGYKMCALSAHISGIGKKVLLASSKADVPQSARVEIIERHEAGEKMTLALSEEIIEKHKAEAEAANRRADEAEGKSKQIQSQFDFYKRHAQDQERQLNAKIDELEHVPVPEPQKVTVYRDTLETAANVATLEAQIKSLEEKQKKLLEEGGIKSEKLASMTVERDKLVKEKEGLVKLANSNLFADTQEKYEAEVKGANRKMASIFETGLRDVHALLPDPIDAKQAYGGDEWARWERMRTQALRFVEELDKIKESVDNQFIDVFDVDTPKFIEAPLSFVEG